MSDPPAKGPTLPKAILHAAACYQDGRLDEAAAACAAFIEVHAGFFDAWHLAGVVKIAQGDPAGAVPLLTQALKLRPRSCEAALNLGVAYQDIGNAAGALAQSERALALNPAFAEAYNNRGNALRALGRIAEALASYEKALALRLDYPDAHSNRAAVLIDLGRAEEALESCTQALIWRPNYAEAHFNRGNALRALGRQTRALTSYEEALRCRPGFAAALTNQIAILAELGRPDEALAVARAALARDPAHVDTLVNCGVAAQQLGHAEDALAVYDDVLAVVPHHPAVLRNRATLLRDLGRNAETLAALQRLLAVTPDDAGALGQAGFAALKLCAWDVAERLTPAIVGCVEAGRVVPPFVMLNLSDDMGLHAKSAANYAKGEITAAAAAPFVPPKAAADVIRIAYLSADFRAHPVAYLIAELIERHDRDRFEVHGVSFGSDDGSAIRTRLAEAFDGFHSVRADGDAEAVARIRALDIDVAVDLNGYTRSSRPGILAARVAPVQVNWLGYPGTMGADFMDYIMADAAALPLDEQPFVAEKIVHLPDCFMPSDTTRAVAAEAPSRADEGLPTAGFVFCCFNNLVKIQRPAFDIWMRLLAAVPGSVLWLRAGDADAGARLAAEAQARGIDPARLVYAKRAPLEQHLARHRLAGLFLDTLPYNAHATASDALWAGLPVLTCRGRAFPGRVGASLLGAAGLGELVTEDLAAYEALALRLAGDAEQLAGLRRRLAEGRATMPLFAADRFRQHLEDAYARMHALARAGARPQSFAVTAQ
jgi:protein O-GlcNAc transferase